MYNVVKRKAHIISLIEEIQSLARQLPPVKTVFDINIVIDALNGSG